MNESLLNFLGEDISTKRGIKFTLEVLDFMRDRLVDYKKKQAIYIILKLRRVRARVIVKLKWIKKIPGYYHQWHQRSSLLY